MQIVDEGVIVKDGGFITEIVVTALLVHVPFAPTIV